MAFEAIVKKQIARLTEPSIKVIDLVVQELTNVVRTVSEKVSQLAYTRAAILESTGPFLVVRNLVSVHAVTYTGLMKVF